MALLPLYNNLVRITDLNMTDDCINTCCHFTRVLVFVGARSVTEAAMCISNTLDILARFTTAPPAVRRRVAVQPVGATVRCRRPFVQPKPVSIARPAVHTHSIVLLLP